MRGFNNTYEIAQIGFSGLLWTRFFEFVWTFCFVCCEKINVGKNAKINFVKWKKILYEKKNWLTKKFWATQKKILQGKKFTLSKQKQIKKCLYGRNNISTMYLLLVH